MILDFLKIIFIYIYVGCPGLRFGTQDLRSSLQLSGSLVAACTLAACRI